MEAICGRYGIERCIGYRLMVIGVRGWTLAGNEGTAACEFLSRDAKFWARTDFQTGTTKRERALRARLGQSSRMVDDSLYRR